MCCHPALDPEARIALTLRCVCGLATAEIAATFVVPEPTMAQRLVRAKRKIRQAGIRLKAPGHEDLPRRLAAMLRVVYLVFAQGHMAPAGPDLVRGTTRAGRREPATRVSSSCSATRTVADGTRPRSPRARPC
jgi:RNA polymerase sigma-70 factor (ECF subfamily)